VALGNNADPTEEAGGQVPCLAYKVDWHPLPTLELLVYIHISTPYAQIRTRTRTRTRY